MTTENYAHLRANGPAPLDEMPGAKVSTRDKQAGIWKFGGTWSNTAANTGGVTVPVYYIRDLHQYRRVVRAWLDANPRAVERLPERSLISVLNRNGSEFAGHVHEAVKRAKW